MVDLVDISTKRKLQVENALEEITQHYVQIDEEVNNLYTIKTDTKHN